MHSSWLICLALLGLLIPQTAAAQTDERPPELREVIGSLPDCSRLGQELARGQFSNELEKSYMRAMLENDVQRAFFEFEGKWRDNRTENVRIVRRIYFRRLDGPNGEITDSGALKQIESSGLQKLLDEAVLARSKNAHLFIIEFGGPRRWRWLLKGSPVYGSIDLFASRWPLCPDLVSPGQVREDIEHAVLVGDVIALSELLNERRYSQTELNGALNAGVVSLWDNTTAVEMLIKAGADVNAKFGDDTSLLMIAGYCHIPVLLAHGARVEDRDKWGHTASDLARQRHDELAIRLLQNQPDLKH
jgi:hypothetical protein